jgi:hypothetical protein
LRRKKATKFLRGFAAKEGGKLLQRKSSVFFCRAEVPTRGGLSNTVFYMLTQSRAGINQEKGG